MLAILDTSYESGLAIFDASYESQYSAISVAAYTDTENVPPGGVTITDATAEQPTIYVIPKDPSGGWRHFLFKLENANGQKPFFEVEDGRALGDFVSSWVPLYTYDFETWHRGSSYTLNGTTGRYEFQFDEAFDQDSVWVSSHPAFRQQDMEAYVAALLADHPGVVSPVSSADSSGVIGQSPQEDDNGRLIGPFDIHGVKLEWGGSTTDGAEKRQMGLMVGTHSGETADGQHFKGALDWMLNDAGADAVRFRSNWNVYVYGFVNPNGRWAGESRVTPTRSTGPNRDWGSGEFNLAETVLIRDAIEADMEVGGGGSKSMHAFFSFHGAGSSSTDRFFYPCDAMLGTGTFEAWRTAFDNLEAGGFDEGSPASTLVAPQWMATEYGAQVSIDPEAQLKGDPDPARYREVGSQYIQAVSIADGQGEFVAGTAVNVDISAGALTLTGATQAVQAGAAPQMGAGSLSFTEQAQTVAAGATADIGVGSLTLTGQALAIQKGVSAAIGAGSLNLTGQSLTVTVGDQQTVSVDISPGTLNLSGSTLTESHGVQTDIGAGTLSMQGLAAQIAAGASIDVQAGTLSLTGQSLDSAGGVSIDVQRGHITLSGQAITETYGHALDIGAGTLTLTGQSLTTVIAQIETPDGRTLTIPMDARTLRITDDVRSLTIH